MCRIICIVLYVFRNQILTNDERRGNERVVENPIVFPQPF